MASFEKQPTSGVEQKKGTVEVHGDRAVEADRQEESLQETVDSPETIKEAADAQALVDEVKADEILSDIKNELEEEGAQSKSGAEIVGKIKGVEAEMDRLRGEMGFREKFFDGQFGGDVAKPKQLRRLQKEFSALEDQHGEYLRGHDPVYQELTRPHDAAVAMKTKMDAFHKWIVDNGFLPNRRRKSGREFETAVVGTAFGWDKAIAYSVYRGVTDSSIESPARRFGDGDKELEERLKTIQKDVDEYTKFLTGYEFPGADGVDPQALKSALDPVMHSVMDKMFGTSSPDISQATVAMESDIVDPESMLYKLTDIKDVVRGHIKKTSEIMRQYARAVRTATN